MKKVIFIILTGYCIILFVFSSAAQTEMALRTFGYLIDKWKVTEKRITGTPVYIKYKSHNGATIKDDWVYKDAGTVVYKSSMLCSYDAVKRK